MIALNCTLGMTLSLWRAAETQALSGQGTSIMGLILAQLSEQFPDFNLGLLLLTVGILVAGAGVAGAIRFLRRLFEHPGHFRRLRPTPSHAPAPSRRDPAVAEAPVGLSEFEQDPRVNTGFASIPEPDVPIDISMPLMTDQPYYFWLEVKAGPPVPGAIDEPDQPPLPVHLLPREARLTVALFAFPGELEISPGADVGSLELRPDGSVYVTSQPGQSPRGTNRFEEGDGISDEMLTRRLFFRIVTPAQDGRFRLRCNIYYEGILVQSHLIEALVSREELVSPEPQPLRRALQSAVDYTLTRSLNPDHLTGMAPHRLSIMFNSNSNSNGTVGLRFLGSNGEEVIKDDAVIGEGELANHIREIRGGLRKASWGNEEPWDPKNKKLSYRYGDRGVDRNRLDKDLFSLASRGYRAYDVLIDKLAGGSKAGRELQALMLTPGLVQIALKHSPQHIIPAAVLYDYRLEPKNEMKFSLCPAFAESLANDAPLERSICFSGACPSRGNLTVVCPSGFWGFRHDLGMPLSLAGAPDVPNVLSSPGDPRMSVAVSMDRNLTDRDAHVERIRTLAPRLSVDYADSYAEIIDTLKASPSPHLFYFYCHGGLAPSNIPYLRIGSDTDPPIERSFFRTHDIRWEGVPRPVVFINGCHTTAVEPEQAVEFVSALIGYSYASGVIGTEITIFEPLATDFAEAFLTRFLTGEPIGHAIRGARLQLLKQGNPLGLAYIPFVLANLHLSEISPGREQTMAVLSG